MIGSELNDKIVETFDTCTLHLKRMEFAKSKVGAFIPLNRDNYYGMDDETIGCLENSVKHFTPTRFSIVTLQ